ncbi:putative integral membrane protein conserved region-domain-containing protein, partial [Mortierella sp. GBAus27b]
MFIYENEHTQECLGIITLPHYKVSVPGEQKDSHIYSKRNPIWLQYQPPTNHSRRSTESDASQSSSKDYYLSMVNCVDKEDLYFTLLRCSRIKLNQPRPLDSTMFDKSAMNTLIRTIHSDEHHYQAAWLNAIMGRVFLGVYKTPQVKDSVFQKLVDKLSRVKLPNILNDLRMKSVHLGDGVPFITRPKLLSLKPNGDLIMDCNLLYQGGFRAEIEAEAVVTVTKKIQPIKVSLVLVVTLVRMEGRIQAWVKPPPCNRIWYGFYQKPQIEMKIEPVVSDKHIKSNLVIKAIENKIIEAIAETMVLPNMDDIPFSETDGIGGIFGEE